MTAHKCYFCGHDCPSLATRHKGEYVYVCITCDLGRKEANLKLTYKTHFHAAHFLPNHPTCGLIHGHTYHVEVDYEGTMDSSSGMVKDCAVLKKEVQAVIEMFDHKLLNDEFPTLGAPTAEIIASAMLTLLRSTQTVDQSAGGEYKRVRLWETPNFCVEASI